MSQKHFDLYHREGAFPSADKTIISTAWGPIELQCNGTGDFLILLHGLQSSMEVWPVSYTHLTLPTTPYV